MFVKTTRNQRQIQKLQISIHNERKNSSLNRKFQNLFGRDKKTTIKFEGKSGMCLQERKTLQIFATGWNRGSTEWPTFKISTKYIINSVGVKEKIPILLVLKKNGHLVGR